MAKLGKYLNGIGEEVEEVCQPLRQLQIKKVNLENTHAKVYIYGSTNIINLGREDAQFKGLPTQFRQLY